MNKSIIENLKIDRENANGEFDRLVKIVNLLRKECPWDKEQTHHSIKFGIVEESYEVKDAIERQDFNNLREELGDVLLQVIFHSNLAQEEENFTLEDVIREENHKMIRRHPHIFLEENTKTVDKILEKWENIKRQELSLKRCSDEIASVPKALPALMRSYKMQKKAANVGFDWDDMKDVIAKLKEEVLELEEAIAEKDKEHIEAELGDVLFSVVNIGRFLKINPEKALEETNQRFLNRFDKMEEFIEKEELKIEELSLTQLDEFWNKAKEYLRNEGIEKS